MVLCVRSWLVRVCDHGCVCLYKCVLYVSYCVMLHGLCACSLCDGCVCLCVLFIQMCVRGVVCDLLCNVGSHMWLLRFGVCLCACVL